MTKILSPTDHAERVALRARETEQACIAELRAHVATNLDANGAAEEHTIDVSRYDQNIVDAVAEECEATGWRVAQRTEKDESRKLVLSP